MGNEIEAGIATHNSLPPLSCLLLRDEPFLSRKVSRPWIRRIFLKKVLEKKVRSVVNCAIVVEMISVSGG